MQKVSRKKTRKFLFQKLYSNCFFPKDDDLFMKSFYDDVFDFEIDKDYLSSMESIILEKESYFIEVIKKLAPKFNIKNMNLIYVLPIYIALSEIFYLKEEIPWKVSINEAVEIAKVYWDDSGKKIVNWVLNKVLENHDEIKKEIIEKSIDSDFSFFKKEA